MEGLKEKVEKRVVDDWKDVFKTYSFIFHVLSAILTLVEIILPYMFLIEPMFTPATYGVIMFALNVAGGIGRFLKQKNVSDKV
jgi:hypothetical protein